MELSKRLQAVADLVTEGLLLIADIGTDHGLYSYLPDRTSYSGESDRTGYQQRSLGESQNAYSRPWTERKDRNQTFGRIGKSPPGEVDTMIAAGMGGGLVIKILMEGRTVADALDTMILQPQSEMEKSDDF